MSTLIIAAVLLTALALLFLLPPLLHGGDAGHRRALHDAANLAILRDQARELEADRAAGLISASAHAAARADLERRVLQDAEAAEMPASAPPQRLAALAMALVLPVLAAAMYFKAGNPGALSAQAALEASRPARDASHDASDAAIGAMVEGLAQRLREQPDDIEGWHMLARSYTVLGRYRDAAAAYGRLAQLLPGDADVLADYADALASAQGATLKGEPETLIARALAVNPEHAKALALSGSAAFARGDYAAAAQAWKKVLEVVPADSPFAESTRASIAEAEARAEGRTAVAPAGGAISGVVELAPALRTRVSADDVVFIYARAPEGPGMPLAVLRARVKDLPLRFVLDDSRAIGAGRKLSDADRVVVGARISKSGSATPANGDLEGSAGTVEVGTRDVRLSIDRERE